MKNAETSKEKACAAQTSKAQSEKEPVPGVDYPCPYIPEGNPDLYDRRDLARWANEGLKWE